MGHSVIKYAGRHEIFHDTYAHLVPCLIVETVKRDASMESSLTASITALLQYWSEPETYYVPGGIDLHLDEHIKTPADRRSLVGLITSTISRIEQMGKTIPAAYLNEVIGPLATVEYGDMPADKLKTALLRLGDLLKAE